MKIGRLAEWRVARSALGDRGPKSAARLLPVRPAVRALVYRFGLAGEVWRHGRGR